VYSENRSSIGTGPTTTGSRKSSGAGLYRPQPSTTPEKPPFALRTIERRISMARNRVCARSCWASIIDGSDDSLAAMTTNWGLSRATRRMNSVKQTS
jgi:hypothetical protein